MSTMLGTTCIPDPRGKDHRVAIYDVTTLPDSPVRLHPTWPEEYFAILMNPVHKDDTLTVSEARIFKFGHQQSVGIVGLTLTKKESSQGGGYEIEAQ